MKQVLTVLVLVGFAVVLVGLLPFVAPEVLGGVARYYVEQGAHDNGAANLVTGVLVTYRGLDTLGEVVVLLVSVSGAGYVLRRATRADGGAAAHLPPRTKASELVQSGSRLLIAPILLFGVYVFTHGHLSPGGGFQGGAIVASAVLLSLLAGGRFARRLGHLLESLAGLSYLATGLLGLFVAGSFLANRGLSLGQMGELLSAGVIPVISIVIGLKVGAELSSLVELMLEGSHPAREDSEDAS